MTPPTSGPCSYDHSYELPLRRNFLLLRDLLGLLRFIAGVLLDRLGVVSCEDGRVELPGQVWGDDAAMERFLEAALWAPTSPPVTGTTTRTRTAARYRRRRRAADGDGDGAAAACAICLAALEAGPGGCETVAELGACSHAFHAACIDAWASSGGAGTCPLCRAPMVPAAWDVRRAELVPRSPGD